MYTACPLCGFKDIELRKETVTLRREAGECRLSLEGWTCGRCGERFLTDRARRKLDGILGLSKNR